MAAPRRALLSLGPSARRIAPPLSSSRAFYARLHKIHYSTASEGKDKKSFSDRPASFWKKRENLESFARLVATTYDLRKADDWYSVTAAQIREAGGSGVLVADLAKAAHPKTAWEEWRFRQVPRDFWASKQNQRRYLDWLGRQLSFSKKEDWYRLTPSLLTANHGTTLLANYYRGSVPNLVSSILEGESFLPWLFAHVPSNYFDNVENIRRYLDWLKAEVGVTSDADLKTQQFVEHRGKGLLNKFKGSTASLLKFLKRSDSAEVASSSSSSGKPKNYWASMENQRAFMDELGKELGIQEGDRAAWYNVTWQQVMDRGGRGILQRYKGSLAALLQAVYTDYEWTPWNFTRTPVATSSDPDVLQKAISSAETALNIEKREDWYRVSAAQLDALGISSIFKRHGGLVNVLKKVYPDQQWDEKLLLPNKSSKNPEQRVLLAALHTHFPNQEILEDSIVAELVTKSKKRPLQLDVYLPELKLGFEYQGTPPSARKHHFSDEEKATLCSREGITLVTLPLWWDSRRDSLLPLLLPMRPDLETLFLLS